MCLHSCRQKRAVQHARMQKKWFTPSLMKPARSFLWTRETLSKVSLKHVRDSCPISPKSIGRLLKMNFRIEAGAGPYAITYYHRHHAIDYSGNMNWESTSIYCWIYN